MPVEALLLPLRMPLFCSFEIIALVGCGIFTARYFYAVPLEQIAETYGNSLRQIQYRLQKMRTSLRKRLEQEGIAV